MTLAQITYPFVALAEAVIFARTRESRAQNAPALRFWLQTELVIFCFLEPASFLPIPIWARIYFAVSVLSAGADLMVLYSIFYCLEDGLPAFGSARAWATTALFSGLLFCFAAALPPNAHGIKLVWLTFDQAYTYVRALSLIVLSLYGYLRASCWPRDLAWTWIGMAVYSITDAVITRIQILESNTQLFELATTMAAFLMLGGWYRALTYAPKPLTALELEAASNLQITNP